MTKKNNRDDKDKKTHLQELTDDGEKKDDSTTINSETSEDEKEQTESANELSSNESEESEVQDTGAEKVESLSEIFQEFKKQISPIASNVKSILEAANQRLVDKEAVKTAEDADVEDSSNVENVEDDAASKDDVNGGEQAEVINLALERLKRRGIQRNIDIKAILSEHFEHYVDKKIDEEELSTDEDGKKLVKIDSKFMQNHGKELVPYLIGGIAQGIFGNIFGDELFPNELAKEEPRQDPQAGEDADAEKKTLIAKKDEAEKTEAEPSEGEGVDGAKAKEPKYKLKFSIADVITEFLQKATPVKTPETPEELAETENARQALIRAGEVFEDTLNQEATLDDVKAALETPPEAKEEAPAEIEPEDEKHEKILKMAKEFEKSLDKKPEE
ncbi:MAG: hypothetical protein WC966_00595 [Bradymonadales bacterium]